MIDGSRNPGRMQMCTYVDAAVAGHDGTYVDMRM